MDNKDNSGLLGRNERRQNDRQPEYSGHCLVAGREYWISGWVKARRDGTGKFFSLSFKPKDAPQPQPSQPASPGDDDVPF